MKIIFHSTFPSRDASRREAARVPAPPDPVGTVSGTRIADGLRPPSRERHHRINTILIAPGHPEHRRPACAQMGGGPARDGVDACLNPGELDTCQTLALRRGYNNREQELSALADISSAAACPARANNASAQRTDRTAPSRGRGSVHLARVALSISGPRFTRA